jgi:carbamoyl-phosphate synthase large subunit
MLNNSYIKKVFIIGSGPIVIGQACEFDYSGVQACKALRSVGCKVVLLNSNPATIMTDPDMADAIYIDSITWQTVDAILEKENPDAILSTMGGQTALNCAVELDKRGILKKHNVSLIGASRSAIEKAESRAQFRQAMLSIGLEVPEAYVVNTIEEAKLYQKQLEFPLIVRPSYTLGGSGGGIAFNEEDFLEICCRGFIESTTHELLLEESLLGWKEFELEVVRDKNDNCIVVCSIENIDPMGIHTGDSITVAPAQTLTDKQYQKMRAAAISVLKEIGVKTGGANVQFAINPKTGKQVVIEMNPRVSRSSALASKATGFPIAKVAALLAVGFTLDQLKNDITGGIIPASFEPTIDYVVTKIPRFNFEKFPEDDGVLTTQMKSVGEVMAIGRTFQSSLQKALSSLEVGIAGLDYEKQLKEMYTTKAVKNQLKNPGSLRILFIATAFKIGFTIETVNKITFIDPWFLYHIYALVVIEKKIGATSLGSATQTQLMHWKQQGFSDLRIAELLQIEESLVRTKRIELGIKPVYKRIDSCAAEFPAVAPYLYSSYDYECESSPSATNKKVIVLGGGPNRIGQGIEFDYCCVKALQALKTLGFEAIMINCNPETVSTDYDMADRLYFEPLTLESVLDIVELEKPLGVILQFGGQTPLKLAQFLCEAKVDILGTSFETIDLTEDRRRFSALITQLQIRQPVNSFVFSIKEGKEASKKMAFPLIVRPSYVLGGSAMRIVHNEEELVEAVRTIKKVSAGVILLEEYLENAIEVDVDGVCDKEGGFVIAGIMEHIEPAGVHSGDSSCVLPTVNLKKQTIETIENYTSKIVKTLKIIGCFNIQFAVYKGGVYILEVNPRASRTIPFVSKAYHKSYVEIATRCLLGVSLSKQKITNICPLIPYYCVKHAVFPFNKFPKTTLTLGPEMRSTGEVMGIDTSFLKAYKKSHEGLIRLSSLNNINLFMECSLKEGSVFVGKLKRLQKHKAQYFNIYCFPFLAEMLKKKGLQVNAVNNDRLQFLFSKKKLNMLIVTANGTSSNSLISSLAEEVINYNMVYATTINTSMVMLSALLESSTYKLFSIKEWKLSLMASLSKMSQF